MGLEINVLDVVDPNVRILEQNLRSIRNQIVLKYGGMCNGVGQMVTHVTRQAGSGKITVLRLWSHGMPGGMGVATGYFKVDIAGQRSSFSVNSFPTVESDFARLAPYFEPKGRLELRSCDVGVGDEGLKLVLMLAKTLNVEVHAAKHSQPIGPVEWAGPVLMGWPDGRSATRNGVAFQ